MGYRWAWCCVNTRCVYSQHEKVTLPCYRKSKEDNYYLIPFLDLLNHKCGTHVTASFNKNNQSFEITAGSRVEPFQQVFINYGEHDSDFLLLEYGFIVSSTRNLNDSVSFVWNDFKECLWQSGSVLKCDPRVENFLKSLIVKEKEGLSVSYSGPSWQFLI